MAKGEKFKGFIKKAGAFFPEILDVGGKLITGQWGEAIKEVGGILSKGTQSSNPEVQAIATELMAEMKKNEQDFILEGFKAQVEDRKDARGLYKVDSWIQKILALIFVLGYGLLSWYLLRIIIGTEVMPKLAETMVTMIWTGTSMKLNTIIDFFFGGSMKQ
jgi:hypothetical protein